MICRLWAPKDSEGNLFTLSAVALYSWRLAPPSKGHHGTTQDISGMDAREHKASKLRLDSWKEIAAFFGRDERTVRRWEKERALPVHRIPGASKGRVFAYEAELQEWLSNSESLSDAAQSEPPQSKAPSQHIQRSRFGAGERWLAAVAISSALAAAIF